MITTTEVALWQVALRESPMQIGDSYGEACRHCGSTLIIIAPPSSAGRCAVCSHEAHAWSARLEQTERRRAATASAF